MPEMDFRLPPENPLTLVMGGVKKDEVISKAARTITILEKYINDSKDKNKD